MNLNTYESFQGIIYCQVHIKQANPTAPSSSYFLSPLKDQSITYTSSAPSSSSQDEILLSPKTESNRIDIEELRKRRDEELERKEKELASPNSSRSITSERSNDVDSTQKRTPEEIAARQKEIGNFEKLSVLTLKTGKITKKIFPSIKNGNLSRYWNLQKVFKKSLCSWEIRSCGISTKNNLSQVLF